MRLGIWTPLPHTIQAEPGMEQAVSDLVNPGKGESSDRSFEFAANILRQAEDAGFETTLIAERWLGPDLEAWILATALSQQTRHLELMVAVHPGIVTPQAVAKMGASLDRVSGGRLAVNIVNGWWPDELNLFGNGAWMDDAQMRAARMGEFIAVLSGLWTQDKFSFRGTYYNVDNGSLPIKPLRQPSPRIYAASRALSGKELVAKMCDVWFAEYKPDYRLYDENLAKVREDINDMRERAQRFGRTLEYGLSAHVICADTMEEALRQAHELEDYGKRDRIALIAAKAIGAGFVGTPELIAQRILQYEENGVGCLMLRFHPMADGLKSFAEKVVPLLRHRLHRPTPPASTARAAAAVDL